MKKIVTVIIITIIIITGCSIENKKIDKESEKNIVTYNSYDEVFIVEANPSWQNVNKGELNKLANLEIVNYEKNKYFMAIMEKKEDFDLSYDEYKNYMIKDIEKTYEVELEEPKTITIDDKEYAYVEFKSSAPNTSVNLYMQVYMIETENYFGRLFAWTNYSQRDNYKEEFDQMVKSFKEK